MASLCQICGVAGFAELLKYCKKCRTSAQHRYCFPKFPRRLEEINWICELCDPSSEKLATSSGTMKGVSFQQLQNHVAHSSRRGMIEDENAQRTHPKEDNCRKMQKRRRLILADDGQFDHEAQSGSCDQGVADKVMKLPAKPAMALSPPHINSCEVTIGSLIAETEPSAMPATVQGEALDDQNPQRHAQPIYEHMWRGCISIGTEKYGPLTAHLSTLACQRVYDAAKSLPSVLHLEKHSTLDSLPNCLKISPPRDDRIGLFFLPDSITSDQLLAEVIRKNLLLKCTLDEVELLMLPSAILPKETHRFREKYYLWGAFRRRQVPITSSIADSRIAAEDAQEEKHIVEVSDKITRDEGDGLGGKESSPDGNHGNGFTFHPHSALRHPMFTFHPNSALQHPMSNELGNPEDMSKRAGGNEGIEARDDEEPREIKDGEIWDKHDSSSDGSRFAFSPHSVLQHPKTNEPEGNRKHGLLSMHALEEEAVEAGDAEQPQEREGGEAWEKHEKGEGGKIHEDFNDGHIMPLFTPEAEKMIIEPEVESHDEEPRELEMGQEEAMQFPTDAEEHKCLRLFTLFSEDLGVVSGRVENRNELNLDLGL